MNHDIQILAICRIIVHDSPLTYHLPWYKEQAGMGRRRVDEKVVCRRDQERDIHYTTLRN